MQNMKLQTCLGIAFLGSKQHIIEHCRIRSVAYYFLGGICLAIFIGEVLEIASDYGIESVCTQECVDVVLQIIPSTAAGIESTSNLRSNIGIIEYLSIGSRRAGAV